MLPEKLKCKGMIKTAFSSHKRCFICRVSKPKWPLRRVKRETIIDSYLRHRIFIKDHARCCSSHLDENFLIKNDFFPFISYKLIKPSRSISMMLNLILERKIGIFDTFKNIDQLNDENCIKITGWTKEHFLRFSKYVTSIKDTKGRTKEQLIALYRFWLRKATDQASLAMLFNSSTTQNQISHYLEQIRNAVYEDIVPFYLSCRKGRKFFTSHNNATTCELFDLKHDDLAIFVDGTYCRCEKSKNNQVQYDC